MGHFDLAKTNSSLYKSQVHKIETESRDRETDMVVFGTSFPQVWFYKMYFAQIKNFGSYNLKDFHLPKCIETAPSLFPVSESTWTALGESLGLKHSERTEVLKKRTGFFFES